MIRFTLGCGFCDGVGDGDGDSDGDGDGDERDDGDGDDDGDGVDEERWLCKFSAAIRDLMWSRTALAIAATFLASYC